MAHLILYGTAACHLCDRAEELLRIAVRSDNSTTYTKVDISESEELFQRYGVRIPVLATDDGREMGWPFDQRQLGEFIATAI